MNYKFKTTLILKNTRVLKNTNARQFLFILKPMPSIDEIKTRVYYDKLLIVFTSHYFSREKLNLWESYFHFPKKPAFKSAKIVFLTSFQTDKKKHSEFYYGKISLLDSECSTEKCLKVFVKDILKSMNDFHDFNKIKNVISFKIGISFRYEKIEKYSFYRSV